MSYSPIDIVRYHIVTLLTIVILGPGCRTPVNSNVVTFWAMGAEGEVVDELVPEFERRNPGISVEVQPIPWMSAHEKLLTGYVGNALPDVFQLGNTWVPEFVAVNAIDALDDRVANSDVIDSEDYFRGIWQTNVVDSVAFGVPWYVDTRVLFYRSDILASAGFDNPPQTWTQFTTALAAIKRRDRKGDYPILLPVNEFEQPIIFALQQPDEMLRDDGRYANFESPDFRRAFEYYIDMFRRGYAPVVDNNQVPNVVQEFARGHYAFYITGPWYISQFQSGMPDSLANAWSTAPVPGPTGIGNSIAGGASLVISRRSANKDAAWKFVEYLSEVETQLRLHELLGNLPARISAWNDPLLAENKYAHAFKTQLEHVRPNPRVPEWERIATLIRLSAEAVAHGRLSIDQALRQLNWDVDALLEKRRWMMNRVYGEDPAPLPGGSGPGST